jgi:SAM-dependent methyltransferase
VIDLSRRATEPELLDEGVAEAEAFASLGDLRFVNRWLGNRGQLAQAVAPLLEGAPRPRLLDVGSGSGDVPGYLLSRVRRPLLAVAADIKLLHLRAAPGSVRCVVADVRSLPFAEGSFDVVTACLFLHHFDGAEVAEVLRRLYALARRALVVNDLRRARVPYAFGRATFPLMFRSRVSVADGLLSIRRAFTEDELARAFAEAGIPVRIRRTWPYRLLAVAEKSAPAASVAGFTPDTLAGGLGGSPQNPPAR